MLMRKAHKPEILVDPTTYSEEPIICINSAWDDIMHFLALKHSNCLIEGFLKKNNLL